ncbi:MAG: CusA/CzcA family heavy metal efflux RND transporter, partial [Candidatus Cyclobacteriaceae bacterium M3_2C_046]
DITNNQVQVITQAPNLGAEDIEQFVTYPVEVAMANLPGVVEIRSISRFGLSVVTIVFEDDMETYLPRQLVNEKLTQIKEEIPEGFGEPFMGPISTGLGEIYQYTLEVDSAYRQKYSARDLRTIQDWIIRRQMAMVPGVVEVNAFGGQIKQYEVAVNPDELKAIGLTISDVFEALEKNNQNTGGAYIEKNHLANFIRGEGLARSINDIEQIVVKTENRIPIRIKDIAKVGFGQAVRYGAFTKDGQGEAVGGMILMLKGANSNEVIDAVKARIGQIQNSLPEGVSIEPFLDRSQLIVNTTSTVRNNLLEGGLIVIFILVILLGNWRGGLIVASTIPLSLLFAFILMNVFDVWANLMSLGAIDFGIIVDGAVIIVESVVFLLHDKIIKKQDITPAVRDEVSFEASSKMMNSAFFGQLIILIVFVPILFLEGVEGKMFKPMALTFSFAMIGAMILCLTYVPMMSALFLRAPKKESKSWGDRIVIWIEDKYEKALDKSLKKGTLILGSAAALLVLAIFTYRNMGGEFIPQLDEGDIAFHVILKPGSSLTEATETSTKIERILLENFPEVEHAATRFGVADVPTDPMPMDIGDCFVILKPQDEWVSAESKEELIEKIKEKISIIPGVNYEFTQPIEMRFNELLTGVREDIAIKLFGEDLQLLADKANEIGGLIANIEGVADMRVEATTGLPQMTILYERDELAQYGLNINDINHTVESAFAGGKAGFIFEGEKKFDLVVRLDSAHRTNIDNVKNLYINTPDGAQIPLNEVANISFQPGPMQISRDNTNRRVSVGINVRNRDIKSLVAEVQSVLDEQLDLPPGYYIRYGGAFENFERATNRLQVVVPIALFLIFILIFFALRSFKQTLMIYMAIPLAAIGGVFSLWVRDMPFSISAGVGFIVLFGVAVLNGLVLINGLNELKAEGETDLDERIRKGTRRRIRPILLTALTDIFGFLPMAISISAGAEVQRPLATVVIGGLLTSTLLTLFILPILYRWTETARLKPALGKAGMIVLAVVFVGFGGNANAQEKQDSLPTLTMAEAVERAVNAYPSIRAARLEVENQKALKKTAWNLGNTSIFTGGEELGGGSASDETADAESSGVYTLIGIQQSNIDVFGISSALQLQKERIALSRAALELSKEELMLQVKTAYADLYALKEKLGLYERLDSVFRDFQEAAALRYEVEETSRLAYLAAVNQAKQVFIQKEQAEYDYLSGLQKFNLWLVSDTVFAVDLNAGVRLTEPIADLQQNIIDHPRLSIAAQEEKIAKAALSNARSGFLPDFFLQYGWQKAGGETGFYQYQAGVSVPLTFWNKKGEVQSAKIQQKIAAQRARQTRMELQSDYLSLVQDYRKWLASWNYYREDALPIAEEQLEGSILAYREGAIDYTTFIQNIQEAVQVELDALDALDNLLEANFQMEYYLD